MSNELIEEAKSKYRQKQEVDVNRAITRFFSNTRFLDYFECVESSVRIKGTQIILKYDAEKQCFIYNVSYGLMGKSVNLEVRNIEDLGKCLILDGK